MVGRFFVGLLGIIVQLFLRTDRIAAAFTRVPPSVLYMLRGKTARFVWDYDVTDRNTKYASYSPTWYYRNTTQIQIAFEYKWSSPKWQWTIAPTCPVALKDRISKESTATLVISNVTTADNGTYECTLALLKPVAKTVTSMTQLIVTISPQFIINPPSSMGISEASNLVIPCAANGQPTPNVTWIKMKDKAILSQGLGSATLSIPNIKRYQNGTYECRATNNPNEKPSSAQTLVDVQYSPSFTIAPKGTIVTQDDEITLNCRANGNPTPTLSWTKDGGTIKPGHISGNTLVIPNAIKSDAGKYVCTARNVYGMRTHTAVAYAYVIVKYEPSILTKSHNQIINETESLRLTCIADGYPTPNFTWSKSPGTITPSLTTGNVYNILSVKRLDAGTYTCTASNGIGNNALVNIQVTVQYKGEVDKAASSKATDSWNGKHITLHCMFRGNPVPRVTWYKPSGSEITDPLPRTTHVGNRFVSELNITTTKENDYGNYRCVVTNVVGSDEYFIIVNQLFTPYYPKQSTTISDSKGTEITIFWCVPDVRGGTPVIDYKVEINTKPPRKIITKETSVAIKGLEENTKYLVKIYARNIAGYGGPVSKNIVTKNPENHTTFILASLITILVISLIANMLFVVTVLRTQREEKKSRFSKHSRRTAYENKTDVEMESIPDNTCPTSTITEDTTPNDKASNIHATDHASHYQSLCSATRRPVEAPPQGLYEPLQSTKDKDTGPSHYASLQLKNRLTPKEGLHEAVDTERQAKASVA